ncbi:hypothetical protein B0O95_1338 [Mycetohabitans endofungorum]|uniref:Phage integrase family protein n=1 Tax=Mycetohabitans endofungorum TaxID=417203 RepID=A0A2P5K6H9_9BURK|nr:hypothetical protein B0O95_1338 [Mycetohabitans endofungorum]
MASKTHCVFDWGSFLVRKIIRQAASLLSARGAASSEQLFQPFHRHAFVRGWVAEQFDEREVRESFSRIDWDALAHTRSGKASQQQSTLIPRQNRGSHNVVRTITLDEYKRLARYLGRLPTSALRSDDDSRPARDRLWADLCLLTGLRPHEPLYKKRMSVTASRRLFERTRGRARPPNRAGGPTRCGLGGCALPHAPRFFSVGGHALQRG